MSKLGNFSKRRPELASTANEVFDPRTGASLKGDVLTGKLTAKDALQREADRSGRWDNMRTPCSPDDYDPVLRHHLRIPKE